MLSFGVLPLRLCFSAYAPCNISTSFWNVARFTPVIRRILYCYNLLSFRISYLPFYLLNFIFARGLICIEVSGKTYVWMGMRQILVSEIMKRLPDNGWQRLSTGAGNKSEKYYDWRSLPLTCAAKGFRKYFLVRRSLSHPCKLRGYVCYCRENTPFSKLVRVAGTHWTVEMCFAETKGDVGFDYYEARFWQGWCHITLAMCAHALLSVLKAELPDTGAAFF